MDRQEIQHELRAALDDVNATDLDESEREELTEAACEAYRRCQTILDPEAYINHLSEYISDEYDRYHAEDDDPDDDETPREKPLCGCDSPTCRLKRGELLPQIRDRSDGILQRNGPRERVSTILQSHKNPHILREADNEWREREREARTALTEATSKAASAKAQEMFNL